MTLVFVHDRPQRPGSVWLIEVELPRDLIRPSGICTQASRHERRLIQEALHSRHSLRVARIERQVRSEAGGQPSRSREAHGVVNKAITETWIVTRRMERAILVHLDIWDITEHLEGLHAVLTATGEGSTGAVDHPVAVVLVPRASSSAYTRIGKRKTIGIDPVRKAVAVSKEQ